MNNEFVGSFLAFKGEDEICDKKNVLVEVTDVAGQEIEISFNAPLPGNPRCYLRLQLAELVAHCMPEPKK